MAFEEVKIAPAVYGKSKTGVSCGLERRKGNPAKLKLTIAAESFKAMGFADGERFRLLLGTGEHHGIIRLIADAGGGAKAMERQLLGGKSAFTINLGHHGAFVNRAEKAVPCQWESLDGWTVEIVLPKWADESNPAKKAEAERKAQIAAAAEKERQRQAREAAEAEQRRKARGF